MQKAHTQTKKRHGQFCITSKFMADQKTSTLPHNRTLSNYQPQTSMQHFYFLKKKTLFSVDMHHFEMIMQIINYTSNASLYIFIADTRGNIHFCP